MASNERSLASADQHNTFRFAQRAIKGSFPIKMWISLKLEERRSGLVFRKVCYSASCGNADLDRLLGLGLGRHEPVHNVGVDEDRVAGIHDNTAARLRQFSANLLGSD